MSDQEINIAIAEACGWTNVAHNTVFSGRKIGRGVFGNSPSGGEYRLTPNYCNNLNSMHEAEKWILKMLNEEGDDFLFLDHLTLICKNKNPFHATARQRAEAFLRTIGKWEEAAK